MKLILTNPLFLDGRWIGGSDSPVWIEFKYARLPNICFTCGRFDHETSVCINDTKGYSNSKFGIWLRAEHSAIERVMNQKNLPEIGRRNESSVAVIETPVDTPIRRNLSGKGTVNKPLTFAVRTGATNMEVSVTP